MKVAVDTNVLVRAAVRDDEKQYQTAIRLLRREQAIIISPLCLCEFAWALRRAYKLNRPQIAAAIEELLQARNVLTNRPAIEAGLLMLYTGGDFADGVLAWERRQAGADTFVSFDKEAVKLLGKQGHQAKLLS